MSLKNQPAELNINRQLEEMKSIKDGWAEGMQLATEWGKIPGGFGKAPSHKGLDWLKGRFRNFYSKNLPLPYLYPTPEGGVQAEWSINGNEASLEINLEDHSAEWHVFNIKKDESEEQNLNLDDGNNWMYLRFMISCLDMEEKK